MSPWPGGALENGRKKLCSSPAGPGRLSMMLTHSSLSTIPSLPPPAPTHPPPPFPTPKTVQPLSNDWKEAQALMIFCEMQLPLQTGHMGTGPQCQYLGCVVFVILHDHRRGRTSGREPAGSWEFTPKPSHPSVTHC